MCRLVPIIRWQLASQEPVVPAYGRCEAVQGLSSKIDIRNNNDNDDASLIVVLTLLQM